MAEGYSTSEWKGLPNHDCDSCEFSTLDEAEMKRHVRFHKPRVERQKEGVTVATERNEAAAAKATSEETPKPTRATREEGTR